MDNQCAVLVLADVDVFRLVARHAQLGVQPDVILLDEFKNILIHLPVKDNRIARVLLAVLDDGQLPVRLKHGTLYILYIVDPRHTEFQRDVMRKEAVPHALLRHEFPALDENGRTSVDEGLDRDAVRLQIFQDQHEHRPRDQLEQEVQNGDGVVVDHAADDAAENVVLHLIRRGVRREVPLAEQVDLEDEA